MANGTRDNATTDQLIDLYFQFLKNGTAFDAYEVQQVKIYDTQADAEADTNAIQTISAGSITKVDTGKYHYVVNELSSAGTYFDRIFLIPEANDSVWDNSQAINPFYVRMEQYGGAAPGSHEKVRIYLNLFDILDNPQENDCVKVRMNVSYALYGNDFIEQEEEEFTADSEGQVVMDLIETTTLTEDTFTETGDERYVYYTANIIGKYFIKFRVPRGTVQANFFGKDEDGNDYIPKVPDTVEF